MSKSLISSAVVFFCCILVVCLLLGLTLMFARTVTLDSVRAIDMQIIYRAIEGFDPEHPDDYTHSESILNVLVGPSGYAFFPLAILTPDACLENNKIPRICNRFPQSETFKIEMANGTFTERFGTQILKTDSGDYYYFKNLGSETTWLIGDSGQYVGDQSPFHQELTFLKEAPQYLTTVYGFRTMLRKSKWTWVLCFIVGIAAWAVYAVRITRAERQVRQLTIEAHNIDRELGEKQTHIYKLRTERDTLQEDHENLIDAKQNKINKLEVDIESAEVLLDEAEATLNKSEDDRSKLLVQQSSLHDELSRIRSKLSSTDRMTNAKLVYQQLFDLKKLWLTDPDWLERSSIEAEIAASDLGRAPFTDYIAFVHMEHYLKKVCNYKKIYNVDGNVDRINALREKGFISEKDKKMLHDARLARNVWFHEASPPDQILMKRLFGFLNARKNPAIRPQI